MKLITTDAYLLLIDEEVICKTGELYLTSIQNRIIPKSKGVIQAGDKIIAYYPLTKEAKELDLPLLPSPFREESKFYDKLKESPYKENPGLVYYFIEGYKAAQSHSKQFSLEDMKKAIEMARLMIDDEVEGAFDTESISGVTELCTYGLRDKYSEEEIIQSLSTKQLPKEFISEYEYRDLDYTISGWSNEISKTSIKGFEKRLKTITNSKGKKELVGNYKW